MAGAEMLLGHGMATLLLAKGSWFVVQGARHTYNGGG